MESRADVVIVGAGLLGLATAYALRGRRDVVVLERETVGHAHGGSHGTSRIFRLGYDDPAFVRMAQAALVVWNRLQIDAGTGLMVPTPQLTFGPGAERVHDTLVSAGAKVRRMLEAEVVERWPEFGGHGDAILEQESAVIAADRVLATLRQGVDVREHTNVTGVSAHEVVTDDGVISAQSVVVCAGPWSRALVPSLPTSATLEHVAYVRVARELPIFVDFRLPAVYGLQTPGELTYKIALHHGGPEFRDDFRPDADATARLREALDRWFPEHVVVETDVCPYDNTDDEKFIIDRIDGVVVGAGTSGHAFKFGPLLGQQLAALVMDA